MLSTPKLLAASVASAAITSSVDAMFRFDCFNNLVVDRVDPITSLGKASAHLHAVSGGNGFSMTADGDAMRKSTCTSCPIGADLSAYWVPQLYVKYKNGTGFGLVESHQIVYYEPRPEKGEKVIAFPAGLRMLAGDPTLRTGGDSIQQRAITWVCLDYNNPHPEQQGIPNFKCPNGLRGQVNFPMCWNGNLDSPDHKSHVAYAEGLDGGKCPAGYKKMVKIFYEAFYSVDKYDSEWVNGKHPFVLANGDTTGFSFHGDFLNGWDTNVLQAAIDQCTDKNFFNSGECPPLAASFSSQPPAKRCTRQPQVVEPIHNIPSLPGNNPVSGAGPATPPPASGGFGSCNIENGVDYLSNDVGAAPAAKGTDCCAVCSPFANAQAFTWANGVCYCKSGKGSTKANSALVSGTFGGSNAAPTPATKAPAPASGTTPAPTVKSTSAPASSPKPATGKCEITESVNFEGNDVGNVPAASASDCCTGCKKISGAKAFSFFNGVCYCKSSKGAVTGSFVVTSGVLA